MSIEAANAERFKRGLMNLTELEGELLEALELSYKLLCEKTKMHTKRCMCSICAHLDNIERITKNTHGHD